MAQSAVYKEKQKEKKALKQEKENREVKSLRDLLTGV
jgi:hypothetical protein